jgi:hypothetical protein
MKSAEFERHAMECFLLAHEVPDPRQRQSLREIGLSLLQVAEQKTIQLQETQRTTRLLQGLRINRGCG